ncbi:MAG: single-stranded DNA-binding protein [Propionibacteriaceae bacterium]|jgi:single-strand DNA-binding protein|nr:single-stranded DNA-binding protein [Propionibacteriaceae bacterium]
MAGETPITVIGNLGGDPDLRFTPSGAAVVNFAVASTPRTFNRQTNQWEDGQVEWYHCTVWRQYAENVCETLTKGMPVIVTGNLKTKTYQTEQGEQRTNLVIDVNEVGPSLRYATAKVNRNPQGNQQAPAQQTGWGVQQQQAPAQQAPVPQQTQQAAAPPNGWGGQQSQAPAQQAGPWQQAPQEPPADPFA